MHKFSTFSLSIEFHSCRKSRNATRLARKYLHPKVFPSFLLHLQFWCQLVSDEKFNLDFLNSCRENMSSIPLGGGGSLLSRLELDHPTQFCPSACAIPKSRRIVSTPLSPGKIPWISKALGVLSFLLTCSSSPCIEHGTRIPCTGSPRSCAGRPSRRSRRRGS